MSSDLEEDILRALRRITRAIDLHSRQLATNYGLTGPQLVCLCEVAKKGCTTPSALAASVSLSQATITGIVDRLVARQLVVRDRSSKDRRVVTVAITEAGQALVDVAPSPLQHRFASRLSKLTAEQQNVILRTLDTIVAMMDGESIDAAPVLSTSPAALSAEEISEVVDSGPPDTAPLTDVSDETPAIEEASATGE